MTYYFRDMRPGKKDSFEYDITLSEERKVSIRKVRKIQKETIRKWADSGLMGNIESIQDLYKSEASKLINKK